MLGRKFFKWNRVKSRFFKNWSSRKLLYLRVFGAGRGRYRGEEGVEYRFFLDFRFCV